MSTPLPQTHHHPSPLQTLAPHLLPHLPLSLPLLRRIQFHPTSPTAHILATFPPSRPPPPAFAATYIDRHLAPETECWIFSTYEHHQPSSSTQPDHNAAVLKIHARAQLLALLDKIANLPSPHPNLIIDSLNSALLPLLGTAHLTPQKVLSRTSHHEEEGAKDTQTAQPTSPLNGISVPYTKYLIPHSHHPPHLPPSYTLSTVLPPEIPHTITRTAIPKTVATLTQLGNVAVRYHPPKPHPQTPHRQEEDNHNEDEKEEKGQLIVWAFLGADGSLTSLYTEPAHRGKGLAKVVGRALMRKMLEEEGEGGMGFRAVEGAGEGGDWEGMVHSDVAVGNAESVGVAVGLGGREGWEVRWVSVELGRAEGAVGRFERGL